MAIGKDIYMLEKTIGYRFSDVSFLERALTHSSFSFEKKCRGISYPSYERLEFLGDAVLEIVVSEYLYGNFKDLDEGMLTKMRQYLVCEKTLAKVAKTLQLGDYLNLGRGEELAGMRSRQKILADAVEALIAAVYLDSKSTDASVAESFVLRLLGDEIKNSANMQRSDYKTVLQQLVEKDGASILEYIIVSETGPEHEKIFNVEARINNNLVGTGSGATKKEAEMSAAKEALSLFGVTL